MSKIYAFCGRKRSGKGVLSNIIKEKYDVELHEEVKIIGER